MQADKNNLHYAVYNGICQIQHIANYFEVSTGKVNDWIDKGLLEPIFVGSRRFVDQQSVRIFTQKIEILANRIIDIIRANVANDRVVDIEVLRSLIERTMGCDKLYSQDAQVVYRYMDMLAKDKFGFYMSCCIPQPTALKVFQHSMQKGGLVYTNTSVVDTHEAIRKICKV